MSGTIIQGNRAHVTTPLTATVTALTNNGSGAIRVTTSAPNLFGNNDDVLVNAGATDASFPITVVDPTHFDLQGSTYVSGGSGTAVDNSLTPPFQWPVDGDPLSAQLAGLISGAQMLSDRDAYLQRQAVTNAATSAAAIAAETAARIAADTTLQGEITTLQARPNAPELGMYLVSMAQVPLQIGSGWGNTPTAAYVESPGTGSAAGYVVQSVTPTVQVGDVVEVIVNASMVNSNGTNCYLRMEYQYNGTGAIAAFANSEQVQNSAATVAIAVPLAGLVTVATAGSLYLLVNGYVTVAGVQVSWKPSQGTLIFRVWRPANT